MANVQYYDVILKPVVTEKSMDAMTTKKYTFLVHPEANKVMIKEAVEKCSREQGSWCKHHEPGWKEEKKRRCSWNDC